jgi:hypothetical protein
MKKHQTNSGAVRPSFYLPACSLHAIDIVHQTQEVSKL